MTTGDRRTRVRVVGTAFRDGSNEVIELRADVGQFQSQVEGLETELRKTGETEAKRRKSFKQMYALSLVAQLLIFIPRAIPWDAIPNATFLLAAATIIGVISMYIGVVRKTIKHGLDDTVLMVIETSGRLVTSAIFIALHIACLYLSRLSWFFWVCSAIYYFTLLANKDFRRLIKGSKALWRKYLLQQAQKKLDQVAAQPSSSPRMVASDTDDEGDDSSAEPITNVARRGKP